EFGQEERGQCRIGHRRDVATEVFGVKGVRSNQDLRAGASGISEDIGNCVSGQLLLRLRDCVLEVGDDGVRLRRQSFVDHAATVAGDEEQRADRFHQAAPPSVRVASWVPADSDWPIVTRTSSTVPVIGEGTGFSIFIASRTNIGSPAVTLAPGSTLTLTMVPCIGALTVPSKAGPERRLRAPPERRRRSVPSASGAPSAAVEAGVTAVLSVGSSGNWGMT